MNSCIYLNNSATSFPKPPNVIKYTSHLITQAPLYTSRDSIDINTKHLKENCRQTVATLFNAPSIEQIIFTSGATESLNLAIKGLNLKGKHVLTTCMEHNAVLRLLKTMERAGTIQLTILPLNSSGFISTSAIAQNLLPNTSAVIVNHSSNVTGAINDIKAIGILLREQDISFIVDASQSAGIYPIDVQAMHIDLLAFTGHKGLLGFAGIGGLYIKESLKIKPLKLGGTGAKSDLLYQPTDLPSYYEAGTPNYIGIASLYEGIQFIHSIGIDTIRKKIISHVDQIKTALSLYPTIKIYTPLNQSSTIFSFTIKGIDNTDIGYLLAENFNIIVRTGLHCAPLIHQYIGSAPYGTVRISPSYLTTTQEIQFFIQAIKEIILMAD